MYKNILILPDGTELRSGANAKNAIRSVKLTEMVNSGQELMIGSCCCDMLEASLFAPGGTLEITAEDEIALWKEATDGQRVKMGIYTVEAPTHPTANTMKVVGYDHTAKLDKDLTAWLNSLTQWPYSINAFASMVCEACGLSFAPVNGLPNEDFQIPKWSKNGVTGRQIMRWLGEITCRYIHADPDGNIRFGWYQDSGKTFTPKGSTYYFAGSFSYDNYEVAPVDIVQLRLADSESSAVWPAGKDGDNAYIITGNPILTANVTEALLPVLEAIRNELSAVSYTPCSVSGVSDPLVGAGSIIHITDKNGHQVAAYVMEKVSSGQKDTYTSTGSHRRDSTSAQNNKPPSVKDEENALNAVSKLTQQEIFNRLTKNGALKGMFMQDGELYINASYLITGILASNDQSVKFDLINNKLEIGEGNGPRPAWDSKFILDAFGISGYGKPNDSLEDHKKTLYIMPGAYIAEGNQILNAIQGLGGVGLTIFTDGGTLSLGSPNADTAIYGAVIQIDGKTVKWKDNGDGTSTLIGT